MSDDVKIYLGMFWVQTEGGITTLGLTEETIADFDEIISFDFPEEQQSVEADEVCGTIETNDGPIDIYSPISGTVIEVNSVLIEDSSILMDDPTGEGWLIKFTESEDFDEEDEDDDDSDDSDEDEDEEDSYDEDDE